MRVITDTHACANYVAGTASGIAPPDGLSRLGDAYMQKEEQGFIRIPDTGRVKHTCTEILSIPRIHVGGKYKALP